MRAAEIIVNTSYIRGEREAPIDVFNQIVFGSVSDNAKTIKRYRSNFLQNHNDFQTKYLYDWALNTISSGHSLIIGIINGLMYLNQEDFFFMMDNWCKNPLLTTIAIQFDGGLVIVAMRRLPGYVTLDRNLRVESTCSDIYSDELDTRMLVNIFHPQNHQNMILDITYGLYILRQSQLESVCKNKLKHKTKNTTFTKSK